MTSTSVAFNSVDYFVLFIFGLSMLAGYIRGFLKEAVSLVTWIAASFVATMFASKLAPIFAGFGGQAAQSVSSFSGGSSDTINQSISVMSIGISFVVIFLSTLFVGFIVKTIVTGVAAAAGESLTNRLLGAMFGGIRGFVIVIIFMFIAELTPMAAQPKWTQSQFVQSFQPVVAILDKMVHPQLDKLRAKAESAVQGVSGSMEGLTDSLQGAGGAVSGVLSGANQ
jgi:membrane protein required for colicin V production